MGISGGLAILLLVLWNVVFVQILPGQAGVRYKLLGGGTVLGDPDNVTLRFDDTYMQMAAEGAL